MRSIGPPPTTGAATPPLPFSPWHIAHFCAKMRSPCAGVPPPGGKPVPSGRMLMSQAAMSAGSIGLPRLGPSAKAAPDPSAIASTNACRGLGVNMFHLPFAVDRPTREAVVVLVRETEQRRNIPGLAALGDELRPGRLHVAGFVPRAALQYRRSAVPAPGHAKAGEGLGEHRRLQRGFSPALAAVCGDYYLRYPSVARIRDARDFVEARPSQGEPRRRMRNEGLHLLQEIEPERLAARQDLRVGAGLVIAHRRLLDQLQAPQELDVHVALVARQEEPHRVAVARHQALAVLVERDHGVVERLLHRKASAQGERVRAFGDDPLRLRVDAGLVEQSGELDAGPLGAGHEAVQRLHARLDGFPGKQRRAVAAAFDEAEARHYRVAREAV